MEKLMFDELVKLPKNKDTYTSMIAMRMMAKHCPIALQNSASNNLFYECKVEDILASDITEEELGEAIMDGGWHISEDNKFLILNL